MQRLASAFRRVALFAVLVLGFLPPSPAQDAAAPALADHLRVLAERVEARRVETGVPGLALAIVRGDEVLLTRGFGLAQVEKKVAVTPATVFPIGSSSKPMTSTLCAMLVTEGKMHWDDPVTDYLPDFVLPIDTDDEDATVTIRDLLSHQTGIDDGAVIGRVLSWWAMDGNLVENPRVWTRDEVLREVVKLEPRSPFRTTHIYSNSSMLAAGMASGAAAGSDWDTLMAKRTFTPLGMTDSNTLFAATRKHPRLATGYLRVGGEYRAVPYYSIDAVSPAGGISSTATDMAQWLRLLLNRGTFEGKRLVGEDELEEIWAEHLEATSLAGMFPGAYYGMSWIVHEWKGHRVVEHPGNGYGFSGTVALLPDLGLGCFAVSNALPDPMQFEISTMVWEALASAD